MAACVFFWILQAFFRFLILNGAIYFPAFGVSVVLSSAGKRAYDPASRTEAEQGTGLQTLCKMYEKIAVMTAALLQSGKIVCSELFCRISPPRTAVCTGKRFFFPVAEAGKAPG